MRKKLTTEEFKQRVYHLTGEEYEVLGDYVHSKTKILIQHNRCGFQYEVTPDAFLKGGGSGRCTQCYPKRKTTASFQQEVQQLTGGEYQIIGEYLGYYEKVLIQHTSCGHRYETIPYYFLNGNSRCPKCRENRKRPEQFQQEVFQLVGEEYQLLEDYQNARTKILMKHTPCQREYLVNPDTFLRGYGRCKCSHLFRQTKKKRT